jgi:hypothetical protein
MPAIPASHTNYTHLKPNGDFNIDVINRRVVEATRDFMNGQLRGPRLSTDKRRTYEQTLKANLKNEWDRAYMQRDSFNMHQQIARGTYRGVAA